LSGITDRLSIDSGNALDDLAGDLSGLLRLCGCDALGDLCGGFGDGRGHSGCDLWRGSRSHSGNGTGARYIQPFDGSGQI
jgi:hypothetical protein